MFCVAVDSIEYVCHGGATIIGWQECWLSLAFLGVTRNDSLWKFSGQAIYPNRFPAALPIRTKKQDSQSHS
jgi:hypothetical protein